MNSSGVGEVRESSELLQAVKCGHVGVVKTALASGFDVNIRDHFGVTPLWYAVKAAHIKLTRLLLEHNADVDAQDSSGNTVLCCAAFSGNVNITFLLLRYGASVNVTPHVGFTPLCIATQRGHIALVRLLIKHGALKQDGRTALDLAERAGKADVAALLRMGMIEHTRTKSKQNSSPCNQLAAIATPHAQPLLLEPTKRGDVKTIEAGLQRGGGLELRSRVQPKKLLIRAAEQGNASAVRQLLDNGADVDTQALWGGTALTVAAKRGHLGVVSILVERGAMIDAVGGNESTPLITALEYGHLLIARFLLASGADFTALSNSQRLALSATLSLVPPKAVRELQTSKESQKCNQFNLNRATRWSKRADKETEIQPSKLPHESPSRLSIKDLSGNDAQLGTAPSKGASRSSSSHASSTDEGFAGIVDGVARFQKLLELCGGMAEAQDVCEGVLAHLQSTQYQIDEMVSAAQVSAQKALVKIATRFHACLTQHKGTPTVERLVSMRTLVNLLHGFHREIDDIRQAFALCSKDDPGAAWQDEWETTVLVMENRLAETWKQTTKSLHNELADRESQDKALVLLMSETTRHQHHYSFNTQSLLISATHSVAKLSGATLSAVPDWFIPSHEVQRQARPFNHGSYGDIYRGTWRGSKVVLKCVPAVSTTEKHDFRREARIWHPLRHPHIATLYGACHLSQPCFFVCEEAAHGSLPEFLDKTTRGSSPRPLVWCLLLGAALGLQELHRNRIVHGDLKCNQILVSAGGVAKLTDFGLSFISAGSRPNVPVLGAVRWKAPECLLHDEQAPTFESDVYAFGLCVVEAITRRLPWGFLADAVVIDKHRHREFISRPAEFESDAHWQLVLGLCSFKPRQRLQLSEAIVQLQSFADVEAVELRDGRSSVSPDPGTLRC